MNRGRKVVPPPLGNGFNSKLIMLKDRQELPARPESDGLYWILSGAIQTSIISEDGRRWIGGFYLPGEFILLERDEVRSQFAQALCPTSLIMTDRSVLEACRSSITSHAPRSRPGFCGPIGSRYAPASCSGGRMPSSGWRSFFSISCRGWRGVATSICSCREPTSATISG